MSDGWSEINIGKSAYLRGRIGWQGLRADEFIEEGPHLVTGTDFEDGGVNWSTCYHVSEARFQEGAYIHLRDGDLLITKDGTIGKVAYVRNCPEKAVLNSGVFLLRARDGAFNHRFLFHVLQSHLFSDFIRQNLAGSTINHLYQYVFERFSFLAPNDDEQARIADVLDSIDDEMRAVQALIAKQERIRAGLLQDLFTRGIDQNGALRPPREEAPDLYHQTELGWLPKGWGLTSITDYCSNTRQKILTGPFGADLGTTDFVEDGVPLLRIGNVQARRLDLSDLLFVSENKAAELSKYRVEAGDLLFARQGATTGRNCLADQSVQGALINYHIIRVALDHSKCSPACIEALFNSHVVGRQVDQSKGRGTREGINTQQIISLLLPLISKPEQDMLGDIITSAQRKFLQLREETAKLSRLKSALMQDLLTGRVSVAPLLQAQAA